MAASAVLTASVLYMRKAPAEINTLIKTGPVVKSEAVLAVSKLAGDVSPQSLPPYLTSVKCLPGR